MKLPRCKLQVCFHCFIYKHEVLICQRYSTLMTEVNKGKRMMWCLDCIAEGNLQLSDVIWTDESSIQLVSHRKITDQKKGHPVHLAGRPKHPQKIHVCGGISPRGATPIVMFTGTLIATRYTRILDASLLPFKNSVIPMDTVLNRTMIRSIQVIGSRHI